MIDINDLKYNQRAARHMREEHGYEMTPEQVIECRKSALRKVREGLADMNPPDDDNELVEWLHRLIEASEKPRT